MPPPQALFGMAAMVSEDIAVETVVVDIVVSKNVEG